jgi:hypothetical protein
VKRHDHHAHRDKRHRHTEDAFEYGVRQVDCQFGTEIPADDKAYTHQGSRADVDMTAPVIRQSSENSRRRNHNRERGALRHVLSESEQKHQRGHEHDTATNTNQSAQSACGYSEQHKHHEREECHLPPLFFG